MSTKQRKSGGSVLTYIVGLSFLITLMVVLVTPIAILIDLLTGRPGEVLPASAFLLLIAAGFGVVWLFTKAHENILGGSDVAGARRASTWAWWVRWRPIVHDLSAVLGILGSVLGILALIFGKPT